MKVPDALPVEIHIFTRTIEEMSALGAVRRDEMEVIARYVDCTGIGRRPEADQCPFYVCEMEFGLDRGSCCQRDAALRATHRARMDALEQTIYAERIEEIVGLPFSVTEIAKLCQALQILQQHLTIGRK